MLQSPLSIPPTVVAFYALNYKFITERTTYYEIPYSAAASLDICARTRELQTLRPGISLSAWSRSCIFLGGFQTRVRDSISPETAFGLQHRDVVVPAIRRSSLGDRAFPVAGARAWNALSPSVTPAPSLSSFRRLLKTFLFQRQLRQ